MTQEQENIRAQIQDLKAQRLTAVVGASWSNIRGMASDITTLEGTSQDGKRLVRVGGEDTPYRVVDYWLVDEDGTFRQGSEARHNCFTAHGESGICVVPVPAQTMVN